MLVNIGFGNLVNSDKVVAVVSPDAAPIKRLIQSGREAQTLIDATSGRRTKSVLVMETGQIVLSAIQSDTISRRFFAASPAAFSAGPDARAAFNSVGEPPASMGGGSLKE